MQRMTPDAVPSVKESIVKRYGLIIGLLVMLVIVALPNPEGLPVAGQRMLGILVFSVIVWMTEAISYPVSAAVIIALIAFLLGISLN